MDVSELLNEGAPWWVAPLLTVGIILGAVTCLTAIYTDIIRRLALRVAVASVSGAVFLACCVMAALVGGGETVREAGNQRAYEAALFDRYGLSEQHWGEDGDMPTWKEVRHAGSTGVVTTGSHYSLGTVKIVLDGDRLMVTMPGGEEYAPAGGDTRE